MYERFTNQARSVLSIANQFACDLGHEYLATEHVLYGLSKVSESGDIEGQRVGLPPSADIAYAIQQIVPTRDDIKIMGRVPATPRTKRVIEAAINAARDMNVNYVGTQHLIKGILAEPESVACCVLKMLGYQYDGKLRQESDILDENRKLRLENERLRNIIADIAQAAQEAVQ